MIPQNRLLLKWKRHLAFLMCLNLHQPLLGIGPGFVFMDFKDTSKEALVPWQSLWKWPASSLHPGFWGLLQRPTTQILGLAMMAVLHSWGSSHWPTQQRWLAITWQGDWGLSFSFILEWISVSLLVVLTLFCKDSVIWSASGVKCEKLKQNGLEGWLSGKCLLCKHKDQCSDPQIHLEPGGKWNQYWRLSSSLYTDVAYMCPPPHTGTSHSVACIHVRHTKTIIKGYKK